MLRGYNHAYLGGIHEKNLASFEPGGFYMGRDRTTDTARISA